ncbi:JAB domain-containing protein [Candidatus Thiosymbion oneisti]|uniref:JAB domain-containing protein n=1 Tax=Candidatus Thiosymbion oneisti TaxID=589554 RepID=UPI00159F3149|nr:JAB domain-containing protein [Candidatus Thiosymbion oneisti]
MNQANKILHIELVALGSSNMINIKPRETFRMAIYKLAVQVIMVHNHPGGNVTPSGHLEKFEMFLWSRDVLPCSRA